MAVSWRVFDYALLPNIELACFRFLCTALLSKMKCIAHPGTVSQSVDMNPYHKRSSNCTVES